MSSQTRWVSDFAQVECENAFFQQAMLDCRVFAAPHQSGKGRMCIVYNASLHSDTQGLQFTSLPPGLSQGTVLEVLDLWGNSVLTGYLPPEYESWAGLRVFRWARNSLCAIQAMCCCHCSHCVALCVQAISAYKMPLKAGLGSESVLVDVCRVTGPVAGSLPLAYSSWNALRVFELGNTYLTGSIPSVYTTAWTSLENFTLDGAQVTGLVPDPWGWSSLTWYTLQNTPVVSNATQPFWALKSQAAALQSLKGLRLGRSS